MERIPGENFEHLTDGELHQTLLQYGFPNVPVTETSRGILIKKLKNHLKNSKSRKRWSASKNFLYSSKIRQSDLESESNDSNDNALLYDNAEQPAPESPVGASLPTDPQSSRSLYVQNASNLLTQRRLVRQYRGLTQPPLPQMENSSKCCFFSSVRKLLGHCDNFTNILWWCFTLFFFFIICMYVMTLTDLTQLTSEDHTHFVLCRKTEPSTALTRPPYICIDRDRLPSALAIIRALLRVLNERAVRHHCNDRKQPKGISVMEFIRYIFEDGSSTDMRTIEGAQYLITNNPQWNIAMVNAEGAPVIFSGVDKQQSNSNIYFVLTKPRLPLLCILYLKMQRFLNLISQLTLIAVVLLLLFAFYRYVRRVQDQRDNAVEILVANIVDDLRQRAMVIDGSEERAVPISHLRDQLIPLRKRKDLMWAWNEAVQLLEENESRIRFAQSTCNGEEFRTMEWIESGEVPVLDSGQAGILETNC